jgi:3-oxoacyl-[acyl-carrier protein] reductase
VKPKTRTENQQATNMKYALVTGGSRGIGRATCVKLAELGYSVLVNYKGNIEAAEETARLVREKEVEATLLNFNVADKEQVQQVLGGWMEAHKDDIIEVLVNNAGIRQDTLLMSMTDDQWGDVVNTSLQGMYNVTKAVLNPMLMNRYGRIINMVSLSGIKGMP